MTSTSENNPLRVAWLGDLPALGLTIAPGKVGSMGGKTHRRDLHADLQAIKEQGADILVNLMELDEMGRWQMQDYWQEAQKVGLETRHFPIRDVDIPADRAAFHAFVCGLIAELDAGKRVVVHCLGGLGRSGTLAACLLIERGMDDEAATKRVRHSRPGAIETKAQENFIYQYEQDVTR